MNVVLPLVIYLLIPAIGFGLYERLCARMERMNAPDPPRVVLAVLFATYGGWLLVILTESFWFWSGLASLVSQAYLLRDRLTALKKEFEIQVFPDREHGIGPENLYKYSLDFLKRKLGGEPPK